MILHIIYISIRRWQAVRHARLGHERLVDTSRSRALAARDASLRPQRGRPRALPVAERTLFVVSPPSRAVGSRSLGPWLDVCSRGLPERGSILFRGFGIRRQSTFRNFVSAFAAAHLWYRFDALDRSASENAGRESSLEPGAARALVARHERSYSKGRPRRIWLCCTHPAATAARTALVDGRDVFRRLPNELRRRWAERRLMYVRHLGGELGPPWPQAFATSDWARVEAHCRRLGIDWEWKRGGTLRLCKTCTPVAIHPDTLERVWFNDAHLCHPGSVETKRGVSLLKPPSAAEPALQVYHADGSAIRRSDLAIISAAYAASTFFLTWQAGDVLMLDNLLTAHGHELRGGDLQLEVAREYTNEAASTEHDPMWL